jgi:hypothetical protein
MLIFSRECTAIIANGLKRNTSVTSFEVDSPFVEVTSSALTTELPSNSTLRERMFRSNNTARLLPVLLAVGEKRGRVRVDGSVTVHSNKGSVSSEYYT